MIGHLRGTLLSLEPETVLVEVNGVGYELHIPLSTYYELEKAGEGSQVRLHVHTHVRDDAFELFGFSTPAERRIFQKLIGVGGIGPRLARVALSGMAPEDLLAAIAAEDAPRLATIPGVGKKTAERMILELRDKVADLVVSPATPKAPSRDEELVGALVNLGYRAKQAEKTVAAVRRNHDGLEFSELLRLSLKRLAGL